MNHYQKFVSIIGIVLILIGMARVPVWYNILLLVAVPLCCIYLAYHYWRLTQNKFHKIWAATFITIIIIYPIVGTLFPETSYFSNIGVAFILLLSLIGGTFVSSTESAKIESNMAFSDFENSDVNENRSYQVSMDSEISNYKNYDGNGYSDAGACTANPSVFEKKLNEIINHHRNQETKLREELKKKIEISKSRKGEFEQNIKEEIEGIKKIGEKVDILNSEVREILAHENLHKYKLDNLDKVDKTGLWIGIFLSIFLVLYLILFYSSATYSAMFKDITQELMQSEKSDDISILFNSIFDPNAFTKARKNSMALFMISFAPFIFIALAFLLHKRIEMKQYIQLTLLLLLTFIIDGIYALVITQKIYDAKEKVGLVDTKWNNWMVLEDVNFYLVIFAGFVVYIILGMVFNRVMQEIKNYNPFHYALRKRRKEIEELETKINDKNLKIEELKKQINRITAEVEKDTYILNNIILSPANLHIQLSDYSSNWFQFISQLPEPSKTKLEQANVGTYHKVLRNSKLKVV